MRRFLILLFVCLFLPVCALAHPGHTDYQGGHFDRDSGEYHFHHGYPAHSHDGDKCPYDFEDRTGENSGASSGGSSSGARLPAPSASRPPSPTLRPAEKAKSIAQIIQSAEIDWWAVLAAVGGATLCILLRRHARSR